MVEGTRRRMMKEERDSRDLAVYVGWFAWVLRAVEGGLLHLEEEHPAVTGYAEGVDGCGCRRVLFMEGWEDWHVEAEWRGPKWE
jgi:hypothetical protein